jgi:hypothetical protein
MSEQKKEYASHEYTEDCVSQHRCYGNQCKYRNYLSTMKPCVDCGVVKEYGAEKCYFVPKKDGEFPNE